MKLKENNGICWVCLRFLFENQSPAHVYYRWKLFTILQVSLKGIIKSKKLYFYPPTCGKTIEYLIFTRVTPRISGERRSFACLKMGRYGDHL